eukprot:6213632-Pleurochrysis_carterae.AAC.4
MSGMVAILQRLLQNNLARGARILRSAQLRHQVQLRSRPGRECREDKCADPGDGRRGSKHPRARSRASTSCVDSKQRRRATARRAQRTSLYVAFFGDIRLYRAVTPYILLYMYAARSLHRRGSSPGSPMGAKLASSLYRGCSQSYNCSVYFYPCH